MWSTSLDRARVFSLLPLKVVEVTMLSLFWPATPTVSPVLKSPQLLPLNVVVRVVRT
jgi:hypothetical protein